MDVILFHDRHKTKAHLFSRIDDQTIYFVAHQIRAKGNQEKDQTPSLSVRKSQPLQRSSNQNVSRDNLSAPASGSTSQKIKIKESRGWVATIVAKWQSDCLISGLAPFGDRRLVLLGFVLEWDEGKTEKGGHGAEETEGNIVPVNQNKDGGDHEALTRTTRGGSKWEKLEPELQLVDRISGQLKYNLFC
jgi:hypothetical protein